MTKEHPLGEGEALNQIPGDHAGRLLIKYTHFPN
jgi:hypothetical protein